MKHVVFLVFLFFSGFLFAQFKIGTVELDEVVVNAKRKLPDLYIHVLSGIDSIVQKGTRMIPKITIGNKGNVAADKKKWSYFFYVNDKLVDFNRVAPFDLGSGKTLAFPEGYGKKYGSYVFKKTGTYKYRLVIETKKKYKEFDTDNNVIEGVVKVVE